MHGVAFFFVPLGPVLGYWYMEVFGDCQEIFTPSIFVVVELVLMNSAYNAVFTCLNPSTMPFSPDTGLRE